MKLPDGTSVEKIVNEDTGDLTNEAKNALWNLTNKDLEITIRAKVKYVGSRVLTIEAKDAYDVTDVLGVRVQDIVKMEYADDK